jgi:hypothetical protein
MATMRISIAVSDTRMSDTRMSDTRMSMAVSMQISMGVSMVIGGSADNTNANAPRIAPE